MLAACIVYLVQVSLIFIGQQGLGHSSGIGTCFPLAGGLCKLYGMPTPEENDKYIANQAACQSTFINAQLYSTYDWQDNECR
jgi:hypothetical protein